LKLQTSFTTTPLPNHLGTVLSGAAANPRPQALEKLRRQEDSQINPLTAGRKELGSGQGDLGLDSPPEQTLNSEKENYSTYYYVKKKNIPRVLDSTITNPSHPEFLCYSGTSFPQTLCIIHPSRRGAEKLDSCPTNDLVILPFPSPQIWEASALGHADDHKPFGHS